MRLLRVIALFAAAAGLPAQNGATVEGTVHNSVTGAGVAGVTVRLYTQQGAHYETTTDSAGAYRVAGMTPGAYESRFEKTGFGEVESDVSRPVLPQRLDVEATKDPVRLDHQLAPLATLRGRVTGPDGKPVAKSEVAISLGPEGIATTDTDGNYVFDKLRPGTYAIRANPPPNSKEVIREGVRIEMIPVFYPSTADRADAQMVTVRAGSDQSGFDIRLQESTVYRVKGTVVDDAGKPVPGAYVHLVGVTGGSYLTGQMMLGYPPATRYLLIGRLPAIQEASFTTKDDGHFEFTVRSGDWRVVAESARVYNPTTHRDTVWTGQTPALVARHDLDDLEVKLTPPFTRDGIVDWGDLQVAPADRRSYVRLVEADTGRVELGFGSQNGTLQFQNLAAGRYRIESMPVLTPGYYPGPVFLGDQQVTGQAVMLNSLSPPVRLVMKPNPGTVRGTVTNGSGATVLLAASKPAIEPDALLAILCGTDGAFQISGLPPGDYSIVAFDRLGTEQGSNVSVYNILAPATGVRVDEGTTATVQLTLNRWPE